MFKDSKYGEERFVSLDYPDLETDMDRFVWACNEETAKLQRKSENWERVKSGAYVWEQLRPDEYIPEQQSFTRPAGASVRRVGDKWVVRERIPSLKPAQGPRRADIGKRIDASMPLTIATGRSGEGSMACDPQVLIRRTYGPAACNDGKGNL